MRTEGDRRLSRDPRPWVPGSWEPGRIHLTDALTIKVVLIVMALVRGADYLSPIVRTTPLIEQMQVSFPIEVWGWMLVIPALILVTGIGARVHLAVWLGHGLLAVAYLALAAATFPEYLGRMWFDGIRNATVLLAPLALHSLICIRTGWRPPRWEVAPDE